MRYSITLTSYQPSGLRRQLTQVAAAADRGGFDTVWVADHLLQMDPTLDVADPMLEAFTALGFLAAASERVRLGMMVSAVTVRTPALLVKAASTVDALSGGRAWLGVGAGYQEDEARAMGLDLPPVGERFERLEEALQLAAQMARDDDSPFDGRHHRLTRPVNHPLPSPRVPVLVGGMGERRTLRLVAEYADACNLFDLPDGGVTLLRKIDVLRCHCVDVGRHISEIDVTVSTRWAAEQSAEDVVQHCEDLAGLGVTHVVLLRPHPWSAEDLDRLAAAIPDAGVDGTPASRS